MQFRATLQLGGKTATGIQVPAAIVEAFAAGKRPPVRVTINGHSYRSTVAVYGGEYWLPVSAEHREAAGVRAGEEVAVALELDQAPREVTAPPDLAEALARDADAGQRFEALSPSQKRRHVLAVEAAKTAATRDRRIETVVRDLRGG